MIVVGWIVAFISGGLLVFGWWNVYVATRPLAPPQDRVSRYLPRDQPMWTSVTTYEPVNETAPPPERDETRWN